MLTIHERDWHRQTCGVLASRYRADLCFNFYMRMFSMIGAVIRMAITIKKFNHKIVLIVISVYFLITCGCAAVVLGTGAAAGTGAAYLAGMDVRSYESEYHKIKHACLDTLNLLKITVTQTNSEIFD